MSSWGFFRTDTDEERQGGIQGISLERLPSEHAPDPANNDPHEDGEDHLLQTLSPRPRSRPHSTRRTSARLSGHRRSSMLEKTNISQLHRRPLSFTQDQDNFSHPLERQPTKPNVLVDFNGPDDPYKPMNWSYRKKIITTILYGMTTCWITFASAIYTAGLQQIAHDFNVTMEISSAGISMIVFGFGLGPLLWAPLSEVYGRKATVLVPYFIAAIFSFATGAAKDIQTVLLTRFFAGFFGSAPVSNTAGVLGDIWSPQQRGIAVVGYAIALVGGPTMGPVIGGAITSSYLRWRWTEYLTGIVMMSQLALDLFILDESYGPTLLVYKARRLRHEQGNWALHAKHEEWDVSLKELSNKYLVRPVQMLFTPICCLVSVYAAFVYGKRPKALGYQQKAKSVLGILYANLGGFSIAFQEIRHWGPVTGNLPFIAMFVGILGGGALNVLNNGYYFKRFKENGNRAVPEARLPPMMVGGILFAGGQFLFGWTSSPSINYWPSIIGIGLTGIGFTTIFQAAINYLVDTFTRFSASAIAANTFLRSTFAGAFPLFISPMYHNMGVDWGSTVFGCVAVSLIPVPFLFFIWGRNIRARGEWSKFSV